jgi:hypothetical protein
MTEDLLHHIWKFRLFDNKELVTQSGEPVEVLSPGIHNTNSGPDFFNARMRVAGTEWAGNVEIHINSSDWKRHNHQHDQAYDNVILHVVYNADEVIYRSDGTVIPAISLKDRVPLPVIEKYEGLRMSSDRIPCGEQSKKVSPLTRDAWLSRLAVERLERKSASITDKLKQSRNDWGEAFYRQLARNFGFKINSVPFEMVAASLPSLILAKHKSSLHQLEALLFGQAGMLEDYFADHYPRQLQNEYSFLRSKHKLAPIPAHLWKLMRLRPSNFPAVRLSQFAALVYRSSHLFSQVIEADSAGQLQKLFDVEASGYWDTHYTFDKTSPATKKRLGRSSIDNIIINTIVPFLFVYGKQAGDDRYVEKALKLLDETEGEQNAAIRAWERLGMPVNTAAQTQALLQLRSEYCERKRCLECSIGNKLLAMRE